MAKQNKSLDTEVNLVAFISLLSVLICSLLLSAVWIQVGSMDVKQSVGGSASEKNEKKPILWARIVSNGDVELKVEDAKGLSRKLRKVTLKGIDGQPNLKEVKGHVAKVMASVPDLKTALIQPSADSFYENIIGLMDEFKAQGLADLGISPL